ncbi:MULTISPECIES: heavy metal translocating P-type ATPase [unclassified Granulicatella]|uniref:heavy metal translocating P-type ATPase n=1 Tax=unclassified Granulicatella TaxID=2630493 RepID=UPI00107364BA|nr:heavy metal translocating P-type ATPase [Granulicatella sp. WM01]MBF0781111.1 heavy metal translocating P-type ATPase [Granulicatella sp. 19428wC4_WM01]TFU91949.1 heavy metal translocating P-type ATPase [Granulicatella sp. WM01]
MKFEIVHYGYCHVRVKAPFCVTLDVQEYLRSLLLNCPMVKSIRFYMDEKHFSLVVHDGVSVQEGAEAFFGLVKKETIHELLTLPIRKIDTPYSIISNQVLKHVIFNSVMPFSVRYLKTLYQAWKYIILAKRALKQKQLNMDVLDSTAILISLLMNQSRTASSMMLMLGLGETLDAWSMKQSIDDLEQHLNAKDDDVWVIKDQTRVCIKSSQVQVDDIIVISEGNDILFDGIVAHGEGSVNESSLTGENFPIDKIAGDPVFSNTVLENGELHIRVLNNQRNARIHQLIQFIKEAEKQKITTPSQFIQLADRVVKYNFLGAAFMYALTRSFTKAISFLVVDFSCALKISTPIAYLATVKRALDKHIVVKRSDIFDTYAKIDTILLDKTGTITTSHPIVEKVIPFNHYTQDEVIRISACLEEHIHHPIANAIVNKADEAGIVHEEMHGQLNYIASKGIKSSIDGYPVVIGNYLLMKDEDINMTVEQQEIIEQYKREYNLLYLGYKQQLIAIFCIGTPLREGIKEVIVQLRDMGKSVYLLTGDTKVRTEQVIQELSFDGVYTELTPEDKYMVIKSLQEKGKCVLMVGDGLNDSAAISLADIGVVMNDSADISKQMSDVVLLHNQIDALIELDKLSCHLQELIRKNVKETIVINSSLIGLGICNKLHPTTLSILHNLTTLKIVLRSLSL